MRRRLAIIGLVSIAVVLAGSGCASSTPEPTQTSQSTSVPTDTSTPISTATKPPTPTQEPTPRTEPTPSIQQQQEQAYFNSKDEGIQELVEEGFEPEFYESGGTVVKGEYDQWLAVWHEDEWLRLRNLRSGGIPVETEIEKIEEKEYRGSFSRQASLAAYFLEEYWNGMNEEMGTDNESVTSYEGWFWKIGVANEGTAKLKTLRIMVTVRDQDGGTPFNVMGVLIFQKAQEGQVAADMDAVLRSEEQSIGPEHHEEVRKYLKKGYSLGLRGLYTYYRIEEQPLDEVPVGRMPIIKVADAVCGQEIDDQTTQTLTDKNAELLEEKEFGKIEEDALLGLATSVTVPVFEDE